MKRNRSVYLDYNATTPLHPEVKKAIKHAMEVFGNPSSIHNFGRKAKQMIEHSREILADFIGAKADEIIFTGSGSEANNTVIDMFSYPENLKKYFSPDIVNRKRIVTTKIEHPCVLESAAFVEKIGLEVKYLNVDTYGKIDLSELENFLKDKNTALVSVMAANNEIGTIQDIKKISEVCHKYGTLFHTDAVQAVGKIPVNVKDWDVDYLTFSAHKIYGPKGIGALYIKKGAPFAALIRGGHQEKEKRAGTENTIGIVAFAKAIELRKKEMKEESKKIIILKNRLKDGIAKNIPGIHFNGHPEDCLVGTLNVSFDAAEGESILLYLDMEGIAVSTGSACASGSLDPSHVLLSIGLPPERAHGSVRMSLGRNTTKEDIDYVIEKLVNIMKRIRQMSTLHLGEVRNE